MKSCSAVIVVDSLVSWRRPANADRVSKFHCMNLMKDELSLDEPISDIDGLVIYSVTNAGENWELDSHS